MDRSKYQVGVVVCASLTCGFACAPEPESDLETFRQALPSSDAMAIAGPETSSAASSSNVAPADPDKWATYYRFTRVIRDGTNAVTAGVLGTVWYVAHTRPTELTSDQATWGPYTDSLEPATWRFRMTRQGEDQIEYRLEGRPKSSSSEDDYQTVVSGVSHVHSSPQFGDGSFSIDIDTGKSLDPLAYDSDSSGTISVTHDLPPTVTEELAPLPRTLQVELAPSASGERLTILSEARTDNTGLLVVDGVADIDDSKTTALEDVTIVSQWNQSGSGRADVTVSGGDVPEELDPLTLVECWDPSFQQSYYTDSAGIEADSGDAAQCPYSSAPGLD